MQVPLSAYNSLSNVINQNNEQLRNCSNQERKTLLGIFNHTKNKLGMEGIKGDVKAAFDMIIAENGTKDSQICNTIARSIIDNAELLAHVPDNSKKDIIKLFNKTIENAGAKASELAKQQERIKASLAPVGKPLTGIEEDGVPPTPPNTPEPNPENQITDLDKK
jgi:hypothetical protein